MRFYSLLLAGLMFIPSLMRADDYTTPSTSEDKNTAADETTQTEQVTFDGQKLKLAFDANSQGDTIKEYIPDGQTLQKWTKLASIREYPKLNDAHELAAAVVEILKTWSHGEDAWRQRPAAVVEVGSHRHPQLIHTVAEHISRVGRLPLLGAVTSAAPAETAGCAGG